MSLFDQLTPRQREVYLFVRDKIRSRGYGPTVREIGTEFDIRSPNGVMCHLKALEKKGLILREPNRSRAIQLIAEPIEERGMPLVGQIAAGGLHDAPKNQHPDGGGQDADQSTGNKHEQPNDHDRSAPIPIRQGSIGQG